MDADPHRHPAGAGPGLHVRAAQHITFATLPDHLRTQRTALYSLVRNLGSSIGISLVIFLLTRNIKIVHAELAGRVTPYNDALAALAPGRIWDMATTLGRAALNAEVTKQAMAVAYANDFKLMMVVALFALPLIFLLRRAGAKPCEAAILD